MSSIQLVLETEDVLIKYLHASEQNTQEYHILQMCRVSSQYIQKRIYLIFFSVSLLTYSTKILRWLVTYLLIMFGAFYFNPHPANVENMVSSYNASKWQMGFNSAFKELIDAFNNAALTKVQFVSRQVKFCPPAQLQSDTGHLQTMHFIENFSSVLILINKYNL